MDVVTDGPICAFFFDQQMADLHTSALLYTPMSLRISICKPRCGSRIYLRNKKYKTKKNCNFFTVLEIYSTRMAHYPRAWPTIPTDSMKNSGIELIPALSFSFSLGYRISTKKTISKNSLSSQPIKEEEISSAM